MNSEKEKKIEAFLKRGLGSVENDLPEPGGTDPILWIAGLSLSDVVYILSKEDDETLFEILEKGNPTEILCAAIASVDKAFSASCVSLTEFAEDGVYEAVRNISKRGSEG